MSAVALSLVTCLTLLLSGSAALAGPAAWAPGTQNAPAGEVPVADVRLDGHTLFRVRDVSTRPAADRARDIADRLRALAGDVTFDPADLVSEDLAEDVKIGTRDGRLVMNVYDADTVDAGLSRRGKAELLIARMRSAIADYRAARTPQALLATAWHAAAALVILVFGMWGILRLSDRLHLRLERRHRERPVLLRIGSFQILSADFLRRVQRGLLTLARWAACLLLAYFCSSHVLARIPQTRGLAENLDALVAEPFERLGLGLVDILPDLIFLVVLFLLTRWLVRLVALFFRAVESGTVPLQGFEPEWAMPTYRIVRLIIIGLALVVAYPYIPGSSSAAFKGLSIFAGLLLSLGSSSMVSNVISGYLLTYRRAFRVGDRVTIGNVTGHVMEMRLLATHIRTLKNELVTMPNALILNTHVTNYSSLARDMGILVTVSVGIGYEVPWRQVEAMLFEAARRVPGLLSDPPPTVHQESLGDFAVNYELLCATDNPHALRETKSRLHRMVLDVFNEYGVQIMTPAYEGDPEQPKLVPRDQWNAPPAPQAPA